MYKDLQEECIALELETVLHLEGNQSDELRVHHVLNQGGGLAQVGERVLHTASRVLHLYRWVVVQVQLVRVSPNMFTLAHIERNNDILPDC